MGRKKRLSASKKKTSDSKRTLIVITALIVFLVFVGTATYKPSQRPTSEDSLTSVVTKASQLPTSEYSLTSVVTKPSQSVSSQYPLAPGFTLTDITGKKLSLSDFRGKVVILDFMGSQCIPCKEQVVELRKIHQTNSRVEILSISVYHGEGWDKELQSFASSFDVRWRMATDTDGTVTKYQIKAIPTIIILDQNGGIRFRHEGVSYAPALVEQIKTILGEA